MTEIMKIERKRILNIRTFLVFLLIVMLFAVYSTYSVLQSYNVPGPAGIAVTWRENLDHAKTNLQGEQIELEISVILCHAPLRLRICTQRQS